MLTKGVVGVGAGRNSEDDQIGDDRWGRRGSRRSDLRPAWPATHSNTLITHCSFTAGLEEMGVSVTTNQHSFGEFIQLRIIIFGWWRNGHISGPAVSTRVRRRKLVKLVAASCFIVKFKFYNRTSLQFLSVS